MNNVLVQILVALSLILTIFLPLLIGLLWALRQIERDHKKSLAKWEEQKERDDKLIAEQEKVFSHLKKQTYLLIEAAKELIEVCNSKPDFWKDER